MTVPRADLGPGVFIGNDTVNGLLFSQSEYPAVEIMSVGA